MFASANSGAIECPEDVLHSVRRGLHREAERRRSEDLYSGGVERRHRSGMRARTTFVAASKLGRSQQSMRGDVSRQGRRTEWARIRA